MSVVLRIAVLVLVPLAMADDLLPRPAIVVDTDLGVDDAVALALVLQSPDLDVRAVVACAGAAGHETAVDHLGRLLTLFNRSDVLLYAPAEVPRPAPPPAFRPFAEASVGRALNGTPGVRHRPFAPDAYGAAPGVTVLALGPLTNLAAALAADPDLPQRVTRVVIAGASIPEDNWNLAFDAEAWAAVRGSGLRLEFVAAGGTRCKPASWQTDPLALGQGTSIGEAFFRRLLTDARTREHYLTQWPGFSDELPVVYCTRPALFDRDEQGGVWVPREPHTVLDWFGRGLNEGRQRRSPVVFVAGPLPETVLGPDLRVRREAILSKNGATEWFAQLLTSELHDHLGAYSILGAKMGLRAAELLNAPPHTLKVTSFAPAAPPVSCLNDGVIVATGATPGRGLFAHVPGEGGSTRVRFEYNGRAIVLSLREDRRQRIAAEIARLARAYGLERHEYWEGVRELALDIWENWHRRDIFETEPDAAPRVTPAGHMCPSSLSGRVAD